MAWLSSGVLPCRKKNMMIPRVSMLLKSRASPDVRPFSLCDKKRLAIPHMNRPFFPTTLSIPFYVIGKYFSLRTYQHPLLYGNYSRGLCSNEARKLFSMVLTVLPPEYVDIRFPSCCGFVKWQSGLDSWTVRRCFSSLQVPLALRPNKTHIQCFSSVSSH